MLAPNGDVIAANGGNGNAVEMTPWGQQVANVQMDPLERRWRPVRSDALAQATRGSCSSTTGTTPSSGSTPEVQLPSTPVTAAA